jgi:16S rRNA (cytosine967-C5)-methyltransferase
LSADVAVADAQSFQNGSEFDLVLLDAPCTATGTIRRHPDILYLKRAEDVAALADLQKRLLDHASSLVKPGGTLVYCTCSLEPEEGEDQVSAFLTRHADFRRQPVQLDDTVVPLLWRTEDGDLRTLPSYLSELPEGMRGLDGFYAAALVKAHC